MLIDPEGIISSSQNSSALAWRYEARRGGDDFRKSNEGREMPSHGREFAEHRTDVRKIALLSAEVFGGESVFTASQHPVRTGGMIVIAVRNRANETELVRMLCEIRQV